MRKLIIEPINADLLEKAQERLNNLTKPLGSLGRLEEFAARLVCIKGKFMPDLLDKKAIFTFAGDHGVVEENVSLYPKEVTIQMVYNILNGGAAINVLGRHAGADEIVIDIGVDYDFETSPGLLIKKIIKGTKNMRRGPAMSYREAELCLETGIEIALEFGKKGYTIFGTGEMGIGNTTPSSAIASVITGSSVAQVTGRGTGIGDETLNHKIKVIEDAIDLNRPDRKDPVDVLAKVGGAEIGGIAGLVLGAASQRIPVVVDGFISTAGALIAHTINPDVNEYIFSAHNSVEKGHRIMLDYMGLKPVLDLDMRLGEGTGAALAMTVIEAGLKIYREMATFDEAGVSKEEQR